MFPVDDAGSRGAPVLCSLDIRTFACVLGKLTTFAAVSPPSISIIPPRAADIGGRSPNAGCVWLASKYEPPF